MLQIVIDGANVATIVRDSIDIRRIESCILYFERNHFEHVVAFVPNFWYPQHKQLKQLITDAKVSLTPSHAHDDYYILDYAMRHDGFIITNDQFRDHIKNKKVFHDKVLTKEWVQQHCIDFAFVGNEFLPNSDTIEKLRQVMQEGSVGKQMNLLHARHRIGDATSPRINALDSDSRMDATSLNSRMDATNFNSRMDATTPSYLGSYPMECSGQMDDSHRQHAGLNPLVASSGHNKTGSSVRSSIGDAVKANEEVSEVPRTKATYDLSQVSYYRMSIRLVAVLYGIDGQTLKDFQMYTNTKVTMPSVEVLSRKAEYDTIILSIYGAEECRCHAMEAIAQLAAQHGMMHEHGAVETPCLQTSMMIE